MATPIVEHRAAHALQRFLRCMPGARVGTLACAAAAVPMGGKPSSPGRSRSRTAPRFAPLATAQFILALPERYHDRAAWKRATELLMEAAERGGSIEAATDARGRNTMAWKRSLQRLSIGPSNRKRSAPSGAGLGYLTGISPKWSWPLSH
jgi:hypothetical protein